MTKSRDIANIGTTLATVSTTELGYLDGVTSAIQTQIDSKLATATASSTYLTQSNAATTYAPISNNTPFAAGKNKIINGDFAVNQRAFTSTTTSGTYGVDRFKYFYTGGTSTHSVQAFTPGAAPVSGYEAAQYLRLVTTGQSAAGDYTFLTQILEDVRTFAGQTVTVSFWAKATSGTPKISTELTQYFGTGGSPSATVNTDAGQVTLSTSWARYSVTVAVPSISGKTIGTTANTSFLQATWWVSAGSTYASRTGSMGIQSNTFDIWGVQIESGSVATPFQTATGTIAGELAACQRYYYQANATSVYGGFGSGQCVSTTVAYITHILPIQMRTTPSYTGASIALLNSSGAATSVSSTSIWYANPNIVISTNTIASGLVAGNATMMVGSNYAAAYVAFNAEL